MRETWEMLTVREVRKEGWNMERWREGRRRLFAPQRMQTTETTASELSRHVSPNRGAIVRHYPSQIMEVSLSSLPP